MAESQHTQQELSTPPRAQEQPEQDVDPFSLDANRYYTTVSVEVSINDRVRRIRWFSDLQLAYLWVMSDIRNYLEESWTTRNFIDFANQMDRRWQERRPNGHIVALSDRMEYRAFYEPTINSSLIQSNNESTNH
jgi:hypothetical protein